MNASHTHYMLQSLDLAKQGRLTVSPNPMVGCIIVKNNKVVGSGYHQKAGGYHAEIFALQEAGENAKSATLYVTLEPCNHHGRTPPCTQAIIDAGIEKVIIACEDPNQLVSGQGIAKLRSAGIDIELGVCKEEAEKLNEIFFHYITKKRPFVISKWAMSLDGKTITADNDEKQISSPESQIDCHSLRASVDAILVGGNTIRCDNPKLTARISTHNQTVIKQPTRVILSNSGNLPVSANVFASEQSGRTIIVTTKIENHQHFPSHIEIITTPSDDGGNVDLLFMLDELGKREITSLLVEGGMSVHHQFFSKNLVNRISVYLAPIIIAELDKKITFQCMDCRSLGQDFYFSVNSENN